jgi:hypothetical protein
MTTLNNYKLFLVESWRKSLHKHSKNQKKKASKTPRFSNSYAVQEDNELRKKKQIDI